jgi:uncharacterized protein (PEP-CTERM system associated)
LNARVDVSESYITNATGASGSSQPDYMSQLGFAADLHEHSRRVVLDANYNLYTDFYARGTVPTQVSNNLQALGDVDVIPEYLDLNMRAFAQPVVTSNFGPVSAGGREIPGSFLNTYGYNATPDLKFMLGDFASSKTMPSYGQVFFTEPPGTNRFNTIPGLGAPLNTTLRSLTEEISSGPDFNRLNWKLVGLLSETDQGVSLLSEKSGVGHGRYALNNEWSLLVTGGYDSIHDTSPLIHNVSGPVALGGIGLTIGQDFSFEAEAGERYNSLSFDGNLRYDLSPSSLLTATANDYVQTPEGQLLNNLTSLTALPNGTLTSAGSVFQNGTASSFTSFSVQSPDNPALNQFISRYQIVAAAFSEEYERTYGSISIFGTRRTYLTSGFIGPQTTDAWGVQLLATRNLTRLLSATLGGMYAHNQEFGGLASSYSVEGQLSYSLSQETSIYLRSDYITRLSSDSAQAFSPLAGNVNDFRATLGISHTL